MRSSIYSYAYSCEKHIKLPIVHCHPMLSLSQFILFFQYLISSQSLLPIQTWQPFQISSSVYFQAYTNTHSCFFILWVTILVDNFITICIFQHMPFWLPCVCVYIWICNYNCTDHRLETYSRLTDSLGISLWSLHYNSLWSSLHFPRLTQFRVGSAYVASLIY